MPTLLCCAGFKGYTNYLLSHTPPHTGLHCCEPGILNLMHTKYVYLSKHQCCYISLKQNVHGFAHSDYLLSPLFSAQSPGCTHHRLFIWRLPAGHGRGPAQTASRHLSAGVCQARQETGVSHSNLPMGCTHRWELSEGHKGETAKILTAHCGHPD